MEVTSVCKRHPKHPAFWATYQASMGILHSQALETVACRAPMVTKTGGKAIPRGENKLRDIRSDAGSPQGRAQAINTVYTLTARSMKFTRILAHCQTISLLMELAHMHTRYGMEIFFPATRNDGSLTHSVPRRDAIDADARSLRGFLTRAIYSTIQTAGDYPACGRRVTNIRSRLNTKHRIPRTIVILT